MVVVLDETIEDFPQSSLLPIDQSPDDYYVALVVSNPATLTNVIVGDGTKSIYDSIEYKNERLRAEQKYSIFIRAYSAVSSLVSDVRHNLRRIY